jgi:nicotinamidase-related amidase
METSSALVIIDVQNEFISANGNFPISDTCKPELIRNLKALIPRFRETGGHVIWVKANYENRTEEPAGMKEHPKGDGIVGSNEWLTAATHVHPTPCCEAGSFGAEIYPEVFAFTDPEGAVITKGWYSAFNGSTALLETLCEKDVASVYFCGVASGTCVLATVIDAVKLGEPQVYVVPDCMGWRRYNTHEEAVRRFKQLGVNLVNSDQIEIKTSRPLIESLR